MQLIITDTWLARSKALHVSGLRLVVAGLAAAFVVMVTALLLYHWVFLKGAREGWPVVGAFVRLVVKDEAEQRERYMRENLGVMARKLGEMQAKVLQLESLAERVSSLAGVTMPDTKTAPGRGGALMASRDLSLDDLNQWLDKLDADTQRRADVMVLIESRLFDQKMKKMLIPTQHPLIGGNLGSHFGWRVDPLTGRSALHEGLDFQAAPGTAIVAAANGTVVTQEYHHAYGNMVEVDHGNDLITRYAHSSRVFVKKGDFVKRGQKIAEVGTTGRSTGPHLHFEVLMRSVPQDPLRFLNAGAQTVTGAAVAAKK
jgi:murein DD-endopeptidase MepM/ murein hydrolase activator NlpD